MTPRGPREPGKAPTGMSLSSLHPFYPKRLRLSDVTSPGPIPFYLAREETCCGCVPCSSQPGNILSLLRPGLRHRLLRTLGWWPQAQQSWVYRAYQRPGALGQPQGKEQQQPPGSGQDLEPSPQYPPPGTQLLLTCPHCTGPFSPSPPHSYGIPSPSQEAPLSITHTSLSAGRRGPTPWTSGSFSLCSPPTA